MKDTLGEKTYRFTDLMKRVLAVMVEVRGDMTAIEIAAKMNLDLPDDAPMVGSLSLTSPIMNLRRMKLVRRRMIKTGERVFGHNVYPIFTKYYVINEGKHALVRAILDYLAEDRNDISESELNGIKHMVKQAEEMKQARVVELRNEHDQRPPSPADPEFKLHDPKRLDLSADNPQLQIYALAMEHSHLGNDPEPYVEHRDPFFKWSKIWNKTKDAPYMLRIWIGRLRLHIFYRGDLDPDCHDHPWDFKTFPFTSYVEFVEVDVSPDRQNPHGFYNVVPAWRWTRRKAEHRHRVIGPYAGHMELKAFKDPDTVHAIPVSVEDANRFVRDHPRWKPAVREGKIVTLVWRGRYRRMWGFWKSRFGKWCWINYRKYIWEGGKDAPCNDD